MAVNLKKGGRVSLSKEVPGLKHIKVGLGWDANATDTGGQFDLDASLFLVGSDGKVVSDNHFIFYNNTTSPCGGVEHKGDNKTGQGDGDDEMIEIDLDRVDASVQSIIFTVTIDEAGSRRAILSSFLRLFFKTLTNNSTAVIILALSKSEPRASTTERFES